MVGGAGCARNSVDPDIWAPADGHLAVQGAFIAGGQRTAELRAGGHSFTVCVDCHSAPDGIPLAPIDHDCSDAGCHAGKTVNHPALASCIDCHMPRATLTATSRSFYAADTRSHVISLRQSPVRRESMIRQEQGGRFMEIGPGLTLDLACYGCHKDEQDQGGNYSRKTIRQLADKAPYIHEGPYRFVGVNACKPCHMGEAKGRIYETWSATAHATSFERLDPAQRANPVCLRCHTTGWNRQIAPGKTLEDLRGVQCEACHGPGSDYKSLVFMKHEPEAWKRGLIRPVEWTCRRCHSPDIPQDCWGGAPTPPEFDYRNASQKILHSLPAR
jgi:hypothetical protein